MQGKTSKGWRKSVQEEEPDKCKSKSSEQEVVFKLQWKKNQRGDRGQAAVQIHGKGEHFACDILHTLKFWGGLPRGVIEGVSVCFPVRKD